jgi:hypothetical protein
MMMMMTEENMTEKEHDNDDKNDNEDGNIDYMCGLLFPTSCFFSLYSLVRSGGRCHKKIENIR